MMHAAMNINCYLIRHSGNCIKNNKTYGHKEA